jgi:hypothetical protein
MVIASTLPDTGSGNEIDAAAHYLVAQDSQSRAAGAGKLPGLVKTGNSANFEPPEADTENPDPGSRGSRQPTARSRA